MPRARMPLAQPLAQARPALAALAAIALLGPAWALAAEPRGSFTGKVVLQRNWTLTRAWWCTWSRCQTPRLAPRKP
jgi:hypothetical protein